MPEDLRLQLHRIAPTPSRPVDVDALWARASRRRLGARLARWVAGLGVVVAAAIPLEGALVPAGHGHGQRVETVKPPGPLPGGVAAPVTTLAPQARAGQAPGVASTGRVGTAPGGPRTGASVSGAPGTGHGYRIAYAAPDGNIYTINSDGTGRHLLTAGLDPTWSPDGTRIAYWQGSGDTAKCENDFGLNPTPSVCTGTIWVMNADGSAKHQVSSNGIKPSWSPDGQRLVFTTATPSGNTTHGVVVANADGTHAAQITSGTDDIDPKWSPDGHRIVFARCCSGTVNAVDALDTVAPDGSNLSTVWSSFDITAWAPAWSPDGNRIAFTGYAYGANKVSIWILDLTTGTGKAVTDTSNCGNCTWVQNMDYAPAWSPDGKRIAYVHDPDGASGTGDCDAGPTTGCTMGGSQPGTIILIDPDGAHPADLSTGAWPSFDPTVR